MRRNRDKNIWQNTKLEQVQTYQILNLLSNAIEIKICEQSLYRKYKHYLKYIENVEKLYVIEKKKKT